MDVEQYLRLRFSPGGRERPAVDCWGLYRLIVGEATGVWLSEFSGQEKLRTIARTAEQEMAGGGWLPVTPGEERLLDAVLLTGFVKAGEAVHAAPTHVGCALEAGRMIDIEEAGGVMVRAFRTTRRFRARAEVANRVRGIFRPRALA